MCVIVDSVFVLLNFHISRIKNSVGYPPSGASFVSSVIYVLFVLSVLP